MVPYFLLAGLELFRTGACRLEYVERVWGPRFSPQELLRTGFALD